MPFEPPLLRPFTADSIWTFAPVRSGVYGIFDARGWIYIGQTDSIRDALLADLQNVQIVRANGQPAEFAFEICEQPARLARQDWLVLECEPTCNRSSGPY